MRTTQSDRKFPLTLRQISHLSKSSIEIFQQCPHSWAARYLFGQRTASGRAAEIGTASHEVIESVIRQEPTPTDKLAIIPEHERPLTISYASKIHKPEPKKLIGIEHEARLKFADDAPEILAYIDLWYWHPVEENAIVIRDHKTNRQYESVDEWKIKLQPRIYSWLARSMFNVESVYFVIGYVNLGLDVEWRTDSSGDARLIQELIETWEKMKNYAGGLDTVPTLDQFPQKVNEGCTWCPIKSTCQSFRNSTILFDARSLEIQLMSPVQRYAKLKLVQDLLKPCLEEAKEELLKSFGSDCSIISGDTEWYVLHGTERKISASDLIAALIEHDDANATSDGMDAARRMMDSLLTVSVTSVDDLLKVLPGLKKFIEPRVKLNRQKPSIRHRAAKITKK